MSIFLCYICDGYQDADDGCADFGTNLICEGCCQDEFDGDSLHYYDKEFWELKDSEKSHIMDIRH